MDTNWIDKCEWLVGGKIPKSTVPLNRLDVCDGKYRVNSWWISILTFGSTVRQRSEQPANGRAREPLWFTFTYTGSMHSAAQLQRHGVHVDAGRQCRRKRTSLAFRLFKKRKKCTECEQNCGGEFATRK